MMHLTNNTYIYINRYCRERVSTIGTRKCYNHLCAQKKNVRISGHSKKMKNAFFATTTYAQTISG